MILVKDGFRSPLANLLIVLGLSTSSGCTLFDPSTADPGIDRPPEAGGQALGALAFEFPGGYVGCEPNRAHVVNLGNAIQFVHSQLLRDYAGDEVADVLMFTARTLYARKPDNSSGILLNPGAHVFAIRYKSDGTVVASVKSLPSGTEIDVRVVKESATVPHGVGDFEIQESPYPPPTPSAEFRGIHIGNFNTPDTYWLPISRKEAGVN